MPTEINNFLLSLAAAIAAAASLSINDPPRAIWTTEAVEGKTSAGVELTAAVYTVIRLTGGDEPPVFKNARHLSISVQADTRGMESQAVLAQAWAVHESMIDANGQSRMGWTLAGKKFNATTGAIEADAAGNWYVRTINFIGGPPGVRGRDADGQWFATGNLDIRFEFTPAA